MITPKEIQKVSTMSAAQKSLLLRTVAKGATDDEATMFFHIAKKMGLDPFLKEIWFVKDRQGNARIMAGRDGFLSIANKSGEFRGMQSASIHEKDEFTIDYSSNTVNHISKAYERGTIIGAWAKVYRKGCEPSIVYVDFKTYNKQGMPLWTSHPDAMIVKVAESIALKKMFGVSGLVSTEEMGFEFETNGKNENPIGNIKVENKLSLSVKDESEYITILGKEAKKFNDKKTKEEKQYYVLHLEDGRKVSTFHKDIFLGLKENEKINVANSPFVIIQNEKGFWNLEKRIMTEEQEKDFFDSIEETLETESDKQ